MVCSLRPAGRVAESVAENGTPVFSLEMAERPRVSELISGGRNLVKLVEKNEVDLIQSFLYRANVLASVSRLFSKRAPVLVTSQRSLAPLDGWLAAWSARWTRRLSRAVVAVSEAVKDDLVSREKVRSERIVVIPNGVNTEGFRRRATRLPEEGLKTNARTVLIGGAGRLTAVKGFDLLLGAVGRLIHGGIDVDLVIAGEGPRRGSLERLADRLGIRSRLHLLGTCRDMGAFYSALDVFALTSLREGSPNVLLEAMACGCAVVATAVGGVPEVVEHGVSGVLVPGNDEVELAAALQRLVENPGLRQELAANAVRRINARYTLDESVRAYERLYSSLLEAGVDAGVAPVS